MCLYCISIIGIHFEKHLKFYKMFEVRLDVVRCILLGETACYSLGAGKGPTWLKRSNDNLVAGLFRSSAWII